MLLRSILLYLHSSMASRLTKVDIGIADMPIRWVMDADRSGNRNAVFGSRTAVGR